MSRKSGGDHQRAKAQLGTKDVFKSDRQVTKKSRVRLNAMQVHCCQTCVSAWLGDQPYIFITECVISASCASVLSIGNILTGIFSWYFTTPNLLYVAG